VTTCHGIVGAAKIETCVTGSSRSSSPERRSSPFCPSTRRPSCCSRMRFPASCPVWAWRLWRGRRWAWQPGVLGEFRSFCRARWPGRHLHVRLRDTHVWALGWLVLVGKPDPLDLPLHRRACPGRRGARGSRAGACASSPPKSRKVTLAESQRLECKPSPGSCSGDKPPALKFSALLSESGAERLELARV